MNRDLKSRLGVAFEKLNIMRLRLHLALWWGLCALTGLLVLMLRRKGAVEWPYVSGMLALGALVGTAVIWGRNRKVLPDWRKLALTVEAAFPELQGVLATAAQLPAPGPGGYSYLQQRVMDDAVRHADQNDWGRIAGHRRSQGALALNCLCLLCLLGSLWALRSGVDAARRAPVLAGGVSVTPGDTSLERGSTLVVLARFDGALPAQADLLVKARGADRKIPLVKSLADPVFGGSVAEVSSNFTYEVEYGDKRTRAFAVTVFEYPRLERADMDIVYPEYTGLAAKRVENTRRLTAVEGSHVDLRLRLNKQVAAARLVSKDKNRTVIPLTPRTNGAAADLMQFALDKSATYELQLVDGEGRTNKSPAQFVFEVQKNRAPELRLASPRGDLRPSALEEISFSGEVWDDFGVRAYGLAYSAGGGDLRWIELGRGVPAREKRKFQHLLKLEELGAEPDQLFTWCTWAEDVGPDGKPRRTTGDLYFAEVRPFEEVFREGQGGGGEGQGEQSQQAGSQGGAAGRLAELQKQIISATWKLQGGASGQSGGPPPTGSSAVPPRQSSLAPRSIGGGAFVMGQRSRASSSRSWDASSRPGAVQVKEQNYAEDATVVGDAQAQALEQARSALERQEAPRARELWKSVITEMETALKQLEAAKGNPGLLKEALAREQAAYQALLKLQEHEYQVSRSRRQNRGQQSGSREQQMQRQLEQMDLTQSEDRYETQRQAQKPQTPQQREQLQVMNRLQELARRQQDLNQQLKELQTALQEARTEQEREEIRRRLKRLQEDEQQVLSDVDELRQRMERPESQSHMAEERRQLDQTREEVQRASEAAAQGAAAQALASGTRAERQMQDLREQLRKENAGQFSDEARDLRNQARELARQQDEISRKLREEAASGQKSLSDSPGRRQLLNDLSRQKERLTNVVDRATQLSEQAETAEPLLSRQLYDTVRKYSQDSAKDSQETQDQLLERGLMTRSLYDQLKDTQQSDGAKMLDMTSEMLRLDFLPQANEAGGRVRAGMEELKRGVERAAENVLGDDTEALRLARNELDQVTQQLQREMSGRSSAARGTNAGAAMSPGRGGTNAAASRADAGRSSRNSEAQRDGSSQPQSPQAPAEPGREQARAEQGANRDGSPQGNRENPDSTQPGNRQGGENRPPAETQAQQAQQGPPSEQARSGQSRQGDATARADQGPRRLEQRGGVANTATGGQRGDLGGVLDGNWERLFTEEALTGPGPITGQDFVSWADRLRNVEEILDEPGLRNDVARARERARALRQEFRRNQQKPDWTVISFDVMKPLVEVRNRIDDELARRGSKEALVPLDRDPVPERYSELVRRYYEDLGKSKTAAEQKSQAAGPEAQGRTQ